jgi:Ser/Thr protein kinase RdoA (MazF antagonist)
MQPGDEPLYSDRVSGDDAELLPGGNMGDVVRQGDKVLRSSGPWTPAVHHLLDHLNGAGVRGVPEAQGIAGDGREVLTFVKGTVPSYPMPRWAWSETALVSSARLLRQIHDVTAGLNIEGPWRSPVHEPVEVICHNDFAFYNLVFDGERVIGVIDWDFASPGPRLWDIAYLAYRAAPLSSSDRRDGFTDAERRDRLHRLLAAYGTDADLPIVMEVLRERLLDLASFSDRAAERLGKVELTGHAHEYRHDAAHLLTIT